jgi:hypothetical protein
VETNSCFENPLVSNNCLPARNRMVSGESGALQSRSPRLSKARQYLEQVVHESNKATNSRRAAQHSADEIQNLCSLSRSISSSLSLPSACAQGAFRAKVFAAAPHT